MSDFSPEAKRLWEAIPADMRSLILQDVWCSRCRDSTTLIDGRGRVQKRHLVLEGECETCGASVGRLIETD